jgi:hypothetical protein
LINSFSIFQPIGNISFTIHVQDDNDNAPRFTQEEYFFSISADFNNEHLVGKLNVRTYKSIQTKLLISKNRFWGRMRNAPPME